MSNGAGVGRRDHRPPGLLGPSQRTALETIALAVAAIVCWHLTVVILAGVPLSRVSVTVRALTHLHPLDDLGPAYPPPPAWAAVVLWLGMTAAFAAVWMLVVSTTRRRQVPMGAGLATREQTRQSAGELRAREQARHTRAAAIAAGLLDPDTCPLSEVGTLIGHVHGGSEPVVKPGEDQMGIMAPTGAGKTFRVMIAGGIDAPGPLVATATSAELLDALAVPRSSVGRLWVFDPLHVTGWPEPMLWNPVRGARDGLMAQERAEAFVAGFSVDGQADSSNPYFRNAATIILTRLLHAAALDSRPLEDVLQWAMAINQTTAPATIMENAGEDAEFLWRETLEAATNVHAETGSSVKSTLAQKIEPLLSRMVLRQLTPTFAVEGAPEFDPEAFVTSRDTLLLITDDQAAGKVAPLTTMLLNEVIGAAKRVASLAPKGRLDPPLRVIGDEIANVAPLPKLPGLLSNTRGAGIEWWLVFQSLAQTFARWGEADGKAMLANLNVTLVLGGLQDDDALQRFSKLAGSVDVRQTSTSFGDTGTATGHQVSWVEREILRPEEIRTLPSGVALMIARNAPAMLVDLPGWVERPDAALITAGIDRVRRIRQDAARAQQAQRG